MKFSSRLLGYIILYLAFQSAGFAQNIVTISPDKPTAGDTLTVTYNPNATGAEITNPDELTLVFSYSSFHKLPDELAMKQEGKLWSVSWAVPEYAKFASFYFKEDDKIDKGPGGHHYEIFVYKDGEQKKGAYTEKIFSLRNRYDDQTKIDSLKVEYYKRKLKDNPEEDWLTQLKLLKTKMNLPEAQKKLLEEEAYNLIEENKQNADSAEALQKIISAYRIMGDKSKSDSLKKVAIDKYPNSQTAIWELRSRTRKMNHSEEKRDALEKIAQHTEGILTRSNTYEQLFDYYQKEGNVQKMIEYAEKVENSKFPWKARQLNNLAVGFAEQGDTLEIALNYAEKALKAVPDEIVGPLKLINEDRIISGYVEDSVATRERNEIKSNVLATFGLIYIKMDEYDKAENYLTKAKKLKSTETVNENLAKLYMQTSRPKKAYETYQDILMESPTDEEYRKKLKEAYVAFNGSEKGFEAETKKLDKAWREKMLKKFEKERLDKKAPSLAHVTDLKGNAIDTTAFKNKIIVIDFWATWCGPCKAAFPYLQDVYEKYEDHPNVKFIVLNSGWGNTINEARKWMNKKDYTFPTYYDKDSKATKAFGVRGIPTMFVLGKNGNIQFKKVGFEGPTMEDKLKLKIDMLLDEADT